MKLLSASMQEDVDSRAPDRFVLIRDAQDGWEIDLDGFQSLLEVGADRARVALGSGSAPSEPHANNLNSRECKGARPIASARARRHRSVSVGSRGPIRRP